MNLYRSRKFLLLHTVLSARKQFYPITAKLHGFHGNSNIAKEGPGYEVYTLSLDFFKPLSAVGQLPTVYSNELTENNTPSGKSYLAAVTDCYCNVTSASVRFSNKFQSLFHHQTIWNNSLKFTSVTVPISYHINNSFNSYRMLHSGIINKSLQGSNSQNISALCYSTIGSQGAEKSNDEFRKDEVSQEILIKVTQNLANLVQGLFTNRHDYNLLHKNVVLENNLFGKNKKSVGVLSYAVELLKVRLRIHLKFSGVVVEITDVYVLKHNGVIKIHWCLKAISQTKVFNFFKLFKKEMGIVHGDLQILEASSDFHINKNGLVVKHSIQKRIPAESEV